MKLVASVILLVRPFWQYNLFIFSYVTFIFAVKSHRQNNYVIFFYSVFLRVKIRELYLLLFPRVSG